MSGFAPVRFTRLLAAAGLVQFVACGGGGGSTPPSPPPAPSLALFAGNLSTPGSVDGTGAAARFGGPSGVATDSAGNVYVADYDNHTLRKITPAGVVTTVAGLAGVFGSADGMGAGARFDMPMGIATDSAGNVYVADHGSTIRKVTPGGVVTTLAGTAGVTGSTDGVGNSASFSSPSGVATDGAGNVYVADFDNSIIRKVTPAGVVTTFAGTAGVRGWADGTGAAASFWYPYFVATDSTGNVYVADNADNIRKISPVGVVTTLAGTGGVRGSADGSGGAASFWGPSGIATDSAGNVYVADTYNNTIRKITPGGVVTTLVGVAGQAGFTAGPLPGLVTGPWGLAIYGSTLYCTAQNGVAVVRNLP